MRNRRALRGFTLIEIMVVVVIIGLLATLVGPKVWSMLGFGQERIARAKCQEYYDNAKFWRTVKRKYPADLEEMEAPLRQGEDNFIRVEKDPWGNDYVLQVDGKKIWVISWGPDGSEGTDDDIRYPSEDEEE
jgi:general secretion pathway protein G